MKNFERFPNPNNIEDQENTKEQTPKRKSGITRIVGGSVEQQSAVMNRFQEWFSSQDFDSNFERIKTPEEVEMLEQISIYVSDFVKDYGGDPLLIPIENIHFFDETKWNNLGDDVRQHLKKTNTGAEYRPNLQGIVVWSSKDKSHLAVAQTIAHEMLHMNAFQSLIAVGQDKFGYRRQGLRQMALKSPLYDLDEAITAELTKRFDREYFGKVHSLVGEFREREAGRDVALADSQNERAKKLLNDIAIVKKSKQENPDGSGVVSVSLESYTYPQERKRLWSLIDKIYKKNKDEFVDQEAVFKIFTGAYFTGRMLPLARLIEKTLGKGAFKKLAQDTAK